MRNVLARRIGGGLAVLLAAGGLSLLAASPASAAPPEGPDLGTTSVSPATGTTNNTPNPIFEASAACPADATNVFITVEGAGFQTGSNAVGNAEISLYETNAQGGLIIPMGNSWENVATAQGATMPLSGIATVTMKCIDIFASVSFGDFPMQIRFTPTTGIASSYETVVAGPEATTTTLTSTPPNPSPDTTVTLTAAVSPATAAGSVQFKDGGNNLGGAVPVSNGTATFSGTFAEGQHQLSAEFTPTNPADFGPSSGNHTINVTVAAPNSVQQNITTSVPLTGALTISVQNNQVNLATMQLNAGGTLLTTSGNINDTTVTDTRNSNPGWSVSGQVTDFAGTPSGTINGHNLGWTPAVVSSSTGQTVTAGGAVSPAAGIASGATPSDSSLGIMTARTLASAAAGSGAGTAVLNALLALNAPTNTPPGTYTATLTLTAI